MFLFGFFVGFIVCQTIVITSFLIWGKILPQYGKTINRIIERKFDEYSDLLKGDTEIIYPKNEKEIFEAEGSKPDDFLTE